MASSKIDNEFAKMRDGMSGLGVGIHRFTLFLVGLGMAIVPMLVVAYSSFVLMNIGWEFVDQYETWVYPHLVKVGWFFIIGSVGLTAELIVIIGVNKLVKKGVVGIKWLIRVASKSSTELYHELLAED